MSNALMVPMPEIERMAQAVAKSGLFGIKTAEQALSLMLIAQAEGRHPALAARDYDIIQGRPAKKTEAMLRDFLQQDGKVEWHTLDDTVADATFSHPAGGSVRISWDMARVRKAKIANPAMYEKYPRAMLRSRAVSEGIRTVCPMATSGMYNPEELHGFTREKDITPSAGVEDRVAPERIVKIEEIAIQMHHWLEQGSLGDAVYEMENAALDADEEVYLWTRCNFNSKQRTAMKKEQTRMKAAAQAEKVLPLSEAPPAVLAKYGVPEELSEPAFAKSIAPTASIVDATITDAARKRLEARISELEIDREEVKQYIGVAFGRAHFSELTKEEYRIVDSFVEILGATTLDELAGFWKGLSKDDRITLTAAKNARKAQLEAPQPVGEV